MLRQLLQIPYMKDLAKRLKRDARLSREKNGFILGYSSLFLPDVEGLPLGNIEAPANVNDTLLVEPLLNGVIGEDIKLELLAEDNGFESSKVFDALDTRKIEGLIARRLVKGRENAVYALMVKDRIDMKGPEQRRVVYKRLRAVVWGFIGRVRNRLAIGQLTWQGLENVGIHVSLVLCVVYAVTIAAHRIGRPELRKSVVFFA